MRVAPLADGTALLADAQTSGRGRFGRSWHCEAGTGLLCTLWFNMDLPLASLAAFPLLPGLAVLDALDSHGIRAACKWPNDIRIRGRKLCGILTECVAGSSGLIQGVFIGIGMNILAAPPVEKVQPAPVALTEIGAGPWDTRRLCDDLRMALHRKIQAWKQGERPRLIQEWISRCDHMNLPVLVTYNGKKTAGITRGIGPQGQLLLQVGGQIVEIWHDDVTGYIAHSV